MTDSILPFLTYVITEAPPSCLGAQLRPAMGPLKRPQPLFTEATPAATAVSACTPAPGTFMVLIQWHKKNHICF